MSRYQPYPEYKDSGVEWIGEVPKHWDITQLKYLLADIGSGGTPDTKQESNWANGSDDGVPWVSISDMSSCSKVLAVKKHVTQSGLASKELKVWPIGTLLFSMYASLGHVSVLGFPAAINQAILALVTNHLIYQKYLLFQIRALQPHLTTYAGSSTQDNLNAQKVRALELCVPSYTEQSQIAAFLDRETTRIDTLIEKKQHFIELLEEKRQAVITQAVTKGLDPNVPMKDSGVEWIGEVPAHWEVKRLGHVGDIFKGSGGNKSDQTEEGVPCLRYGEIYTRYDSFLEKPVNYVSAESASVYTPLHPGDVVFTASGEDVSEIGKAVAVMFDGPLVCGGDTIILRPRWHANHSTKFLGYLANAAPIAAQKSVSGTGFTVVHISGGKIKEVRLAWPQSGEQSEIATFLDRETTRIDILIEKTRQSIELLKERRSALITAAVTGKIDVREEAA